MRKKQELSEDRIRLLKDFCRNIALDLKDFKTLNLALTHSSRNHEDNGSESECNERLEFLGDAVLQLCVSEELYKSEPDMNEGRMTKVRSVSVCEKTLAELAEEINLGDYLLLGKGEELNGGRKSTANLADAAEALFGAVFLEKGFDFTKKFILSLLSETIKSAKAGDLIFDYKSRLYELCNSLKLNLSFETLEQTGPPHRPQFLIAALINGDEVSRAAGGSKKEAEQKASKEAYYILLDTAEKLAGQTKEPR